MIDVLLGLFDDLSDILRQFSGQSVLELSFDFFGIGQDEQMVGTYWEGQVAFGVAERLL